MARRIALALALCLGSPVLESAVLGSSRGSGFGLGSTAVAQEQQHTVRSGQSLGRIAARYRVRVQDLAGANDLPVSAQLREGQVLRIPVAGYHYVRTGETLSTIARRRAVGVRELAQANRLRDDATLRPGQRLLLPGQVAEEEREEAASRWGRPRRPGVVSLVRVSTRERLSLRVLDSRGRPRSAARRRVGHLLRHRRTGGEHLPSSRLLELLVRVSDHFGGRAIHVLSGYRPPGGHTEESSHHTDGSAIDLRIPGVPNRDLRDFLRTLPDVGVGYYPNSSFVHFDVRSRSAYWVDRSGPGESPDYVRDRTARENVDEEEAIEAREQARRPSAESEPEPEEAAEAEPSGVAEVTGA
ncbi:MAG: LysM peptidoglycan-binding domain-containing protein [Myxococcota bacterium]|jgi:uncharacterized protein YcbK (DUF882 family)|nr:LysM peptidoglycan-binding domain-containing protein [Myxococcota bacterium]